MVEDVAAALALIQSQLVGLVMALRDGGRLTPVQADQLLDIVLAAPTTDRDDLAAELLRCLGSPPDDGPSSDAAPL